MTATEIRVFVNDRGVTVASGSVALDAVSALFPEDAEGIAAGRLRLTDSRGLPVAAETPVHAGAIFRVVAARARLEEAVE